MISMVNFDIDYRIALLEDIIKASTDRHERHYFEEKLAYLENLKRKY